VEGQCLCRCDAHWRDTWHSGHLERIVFNAKN